MEKFNLDHIPGWNDYEPKKVEKVAPKLMSNIPTNHQGGSLSMLPITAEEQVEMDARNERNRKSYGHAPLSEGEKSVASFVVSAAFIVIVLVIFLPICLGIGAGAGAVIGSALAGMSVPGLLAVIVLLLLVSVCR